MYVTTVMPSSPHHPDVMYFIACFECTSFSVFWFVCKPFLKLPSLAIHVPETRVLRSPSIYNNTRTNTTRQPFSA